MKIVYQGSPGAYSHLAAELIFPNYEYVPSKTFEECFKLCYENDNYKTIQKNFVEPISTCNDLILEIGVLISHAFNAHG